MLDARLLQNNNTGNNYYSGDAFNGERDFLEFVGFLAWYLMLVTCCIIPPCLAYRRRRNWERRNARQIYLQRMAASGLIILGESERHNEELDEEARIEKTRKILNALKATTMTIDENDLVRKKLTENDEIGDDNVNEEEGGIEENENTMLRLGDVPNGNREVPAICTICLASYEIDDSVCHSPNEHCIHVFHTDCAVTWLAKKDQTLCPCCRQEFCEVNNSRQDEDTNEGSQSVNTVTVINFSV